MLDKLEFYHGAALVRLMEHPQCRSVRKCGLGYVVNDEVYVLVKYTTKHRSPWRFSFDHDDLSGLKSDAQTWKTAVVALVCGGDGVCALTMGQCDRLLGGGMGWISAKRGFNESYAVAGSADELEHKVPVMFWPLLVFESIRTGTQSTIPVCPKPTEASFATAAMPSRSSMS
ncbi:MAG: hypothetical protein PHZ25_03235 [Candidatus Pacebacteria bacterium]|nr:hypothetical protein [Candidatus Paceibacterota bacterium]